MSDTKERCCKHCFESFPDLDCDNMYRCFLKDKYVRGGSVCQNFKPIHDNRTQFEIFIDNLRGVFSRWQKVMRRI